VGRGINFFVCFCDVGGLCVILLLVLVECGWFYLFGSCSESITNR